MDMVWVCLDVPATNVARLLTLQTTACLLQTAICLLQTAVCLLQAQMLKKYTAWSPRFRKHFKLLESVQNSRSYHKTKIACQNEFSTVKNTPDKIMKKLVHGNLGNLIFSTRIWWILFWTYLREFWIFFVENFFKKSVWFFSVSNR